MVGGVALSVRGGDDAVLVGKFVDQFVEQALGGVGSENGLAADGVADRAVYAWQDAVVAGIVADDLSEFFFVVFHVCFPFGGYIVRVSKLYFSSAVATWRARALAVVPITGMR